MIKKNIVWIMLLCSVLAPHTAMPVTAQPGENIWHLAASIGTQVDQIEALVSQQDASIFEDLNIIQQETIIINSLIDNLQTTFTTDFAGTATVIASLQGTSGCSCLPISITITTATDISKSGVYCLANDVAATGAITISASNVIFDLGGHTINGPAGSTAITLSAGVNNVMISNGIIIPASTRNGIDFGGAGIQNITFENLEILTPVAIGINGTSSPKNVFINNVIIRASSSDSIRITNGQNIIFKNSQIFNSAAAGFRIQTGSKNIQFNNCAANTCVRGFQVSDNFDLLLLSCNTKSNSLSGFEITGTSAPAYIKDCTSENDATGFIKSSVSASSYYIFESCDAIASTTGFNLASQNGIIINCTAQSCATDCFNSSTNKMIFKNCKAINTTPSGTNTGFNIISGSNILLSDCIARRSTTGYKLDAGLGTTVIENCLASGNTTGFSETATNANIFFLLNSAILNTTNYNNVTFGGSSSAPEMTLTSTGRLYGDNLKNV